MPFVLGANSAGGYNITNSLRFNRGSSDYLSKTYSSNGNRRLWTFSTWVKKCDNTSTSLFLLSSGDSTPRETTIYFYNNQLQVEYYTSGVNNYYLRTTRLFRDTSAWYHVVVIWDTDNATSSERIRIYVNGERETSFSVSNYPPINLDSYINSSVTPTSIGRYWNNGDYLNGYLSDTFFIDGQSLTPTSFGETDEDTGIWKPKAYTGTYGTNGFYLQFKNSASLGTDSSGNGNNFTVNNLTSVDQSTDTPTNNFATMNPLGNAYPASTFSEGNLKMVTSGSSSTWSYNLATIGVSAGKWYWETKVTKSSVMSVGICSSFSTGTTDEFYTKADGYAYISNGNVYNNGSTILTSMGTYTTGDIIGVALDLTNNKIYFSKNGTFINSANPANGTNGSTVTAPSSFTSGNYFPAVGDNDTASETFELNFGSPIYSANSYTDGAGYGNFSYAVPSGYYALNTKNLAQFG